MDRNKPPDPDPPDISFAPPSPNYPLSQFADVACSIAESQIPSHSESQSSSNQNGRKRSGEDNNAYKPAKQQRNQIGRSRYSATDKAPFIVHVSRLESQPNAAIPTFNITRMGVVTGVPTDLTEEEAMNYLTVPSGCGRILKVRRISRKIFRDGVTEFKPTETCVITFDGQVLPTRIYCCYTSLPVSQYVYPTIQCRKCCRFGHVESICRSKPRCSKCGHDHPGDGCNISEGEAFCVLCSGNHYANSKSCPELGRQKAIKNLMAEKSLSYAEVSKTIPPVSRNYANAVKSTVSNSQSYRKTVYLKPKTHAPLSPSYDKVAHQHIINSPPSSQPNGCALSSPLDDSNNFSSIIELLSKVLTTILSNNSQIPSNVAHQLVTLLLNIKNGASPGIPTVECEERVS
ncbi:uncharacterized protein LOC126055564 isoform X1 [Helicoverpa armigera]|uniref:uncharacterized protein LOC126055564 isoform X1 n=1 Tax=Helicoverpa armigera TaxID=29058 RepID=UPI0030831937